MPNSVTAAIERWKTAVHESGAADQVEAAARAGLSLANMRVGLAEHAARAARRNEGEAYERMRQLVVSPAVNSDGLRADTEARTPDRA